MGSGTKPPDAPWPLIGRREELRNLTYALVERRSRLVLGPPGAGKTRLVREAERLAGQRCAWAERPRALHAFLVEAAEQLHCRIERFADLEQATSMSLKPAVLDALQRSPRCVAIDDLAWADPRMYRFLRELYYLPDVCLIVTAASRDSLGYVRRLLWDPREEIALEPLNRVESQELFEAAADRYQLRSLDLEDFRRKALAAARGNPGQIVSMCRLAGRPEYHNGRYVKFLPLRMDALSSRLP
ncbi:MAG: ATP-binding protein [Bryobacteraceae bacterium]|nr:ATP-binding protein [Bryobacteraceae bacterium]